MSRSRSLLILLPVAAAALIAAACTKTVEGPAGASPPFPEQLQVTGGGRVTAAPDLAVLDLGVSVLRESVAAALSEGAALMARVLDALHASGISDADITTTYFSVYPEYTHSPEGQQSISGYRVSNNVSVRLHDIDAVGTVFDDAAAAGGDEIIVNGVSFTIENTEPLVDQARDLAAKDARRRADQLAGELGVRIERVLSVAEFGGATPPVLFRGDGRGGEQAAAIQPTPVSGGQVEVVVSVAITYAID